MFKIYKLEAGFSNLLLAIAIVMGVLIFQLTVAASQVDAAPPLPDGPDGGVVALALAIGAANDFPNPTTITLAKNGTYVLTGALPNITSKITINGRGSTIDGADTYQVFSVGAGGGDLTLKDLTVTGGSASDGGGIWNQGALTLQDSTISGNSAGEDGGGIFNYDGTVSIRNSTISGNTAAFVGGGGLFNSGGTVDIDRSIIDGNMAPNGAAIFNSGSSAILHIDRSTIKDNTVLFRGGGILNFLGTLTMNRSTISDNTSGAVGGAIYNAGALDIDNSTISGNTAPLGGGIWNENGTLTVTKSIISGNTAVGDGGGINNLAGTVTISQNTISDNTATTGDGGGVWNGDVLIGDENNNIFQNNIPDNIFVAPP